MLVNGAPGAKTGQYRVNTMVADAMTLRNAILYEGLQLLGR